jgi:6-phosphogluconate dehydrogenase
MWRFIDPIWKAWQKNLVPLDTYKKHSNSVVNKSFVSKAPELDSGRNEVGIIGLGKMGGNVALRLHEKGWNVVGYNRTSEVTKTFEKGGIIGKYSLEELVKSLKPSRTIWIMLPEGPALDEIIFGKDGLVQYLKKGDTIIDAGNSLYKNSRKRYKKLKRLGFNFIDVGVSGGPGGARNGACLMVGGEYKVFEKHFKLFSDVAAVGAVAHFEGEGAGHFVKMVHNGIEYGMMQAIAEGFAVLKKSKYTLDLEKITAIYNNGSVIESRLIKWLNDAFKIYGQSLDNVSGKVHHTGEGKWTIDAAKELEIPIKVIEDSLKFRIRSEKDPSYTGKILSALRNQFGGHSIKKQQLHVKTKIK